uniref:Uncharacterized protein n=1 Tax=Nothoprocta perdicaria TaxID=30464 RepID=A0A8C6YL01_NOTPE
CCLGVPFKKHRQSRFSTIIKAPRISGKRVSLSFEAVLSALKIYCLVIISLQGSSQDYMSLLSRENIFKTKCFQLLYNFIWIVIAK